MTHTPNLGTQCMSNTVLIKTEAFTTALPHDHHHQHPPPPARCHPAWSNKCQQKTLGRVARVWSHTLSEVNAKGRSEAQSGLRFEKTPLGNLSSPKLKVLLQYWSPRCTEDNQGNNKPLQRIYTHSKINTHEKMRSFISHQGDAHENQNEILFHDYWNG